MVDSLVWNKKSIINIDKDTMSKSTGTATVNNSSLVLGANSSATYNYSYGTTDNTMKTSNLKFILDVLNSDKTINSRYNEDVQVEIYIQYYKKQLDTSGNEAGYVLGINDTYQINPYFNHEKEGYTSVYELEIKDEFMVFIEINFINNSSNTITFIKPQVFNSMSVMDAIDEYGGGGQSGGDTPPLIKALTLYSLEEKYTIDKMNESLTLQVFIPDEYVNKYKVSYGSGFTPEIDVNYTFTTISGNPIFNINKLSIQQDYTKDDGTKDTIIINDGRCTITSVGGNGVMRVRAELKKDSTIYAERDIPVTNNNVTDMTLTINSDSGKVDGKQVLNATIKILPENNRSGVGGAYNDVKISVASYDGKGSVRLLDDAYNEYYTMDYQLTGGVVNFQLRGKSGGKVKMTVEILSLTTQSYQRLFPSGFKKEFIIDVINVPVVSDLYISKVDDNIGEGTSESYKIYVTTSRSNNLSTGSTYGIQSVDGAGKARVRLLTTSDSKTLTYEIFPIAVGKVKFYGEMDEVISPVTQYLGRVEYEFNITSLYKELTGTVETNTGLFEITDGGGQLEVYTRPNYSWYGGYSFSQVSIDGGSVTIEDKGDYALITADKNGRLNLICTPTYGPNLSCEIAISGQYPENVQLTCADNVFKVPIGGTIMIYAEAGNKPNSNYDKYDWVSEKLDADVSWEFTGWDKYTRYKGLNLGKIRVSAVRKVDSKFMASQVIKVVQSLDSDKTVINYPNTYKYWVIYRRTDQSNKLWLLTIEGTVTLDKLIKKTNIIYTDNVTLGNYKQYKLDSGTWTQHGSWSGGTDPSTSVGIMYASNLDIYDGAGNLILTKIDSYDDVDFDKIIYG